MTATLPVYVDASSASVIISAGQQDATIRIDLVVLEIDRHMPGRNQRTGPLGPLHNDERVRRRDLVPPDVDELGRPLDAVQIQMVHRRSWRLVPMHERERRTRHRLCHAVSRAYGLRERRLSRSQVASERDDERRRGRPTQRLTCLLYT